VFTNETPLDVEKFIGASYSNLAQQGVPPGVAIEFNIDGTDTSYLVAHIQVLSLLSIL